MYGFGRFERDGISYSVKPGDIFVIPPYEKTYYEADQKKPWRYIWIGFTTDQSVPEQLLKPIIHCPSAGKIFEEMLQCEKMENGRTAFLCAKLWEFFSILLDNAKSDTDYVQKAINCINACLLYTSCQITFPATIASGSDTDAMQTKYSG